MVPKKYLIFIFMAGITVICHAITYENYFSTERIRMNYTIEGSDKTIRIDGINFSREFPWAGSKTNLIDTFRYGQFMFEVYDFETEKLIYSRGYSNLFQEWQSTAEAKEITRSFNECLIFPAPKREVILKLYIRDSNLVFQEIMNYRFDPHMSVLVDDIVESERIIAINGSELIDKALDIAFVSEGYTHEQKSKFIYDVERFKDELFKWQPYAQYQDKVNIKAVFIPSDDEGVDISGDSIWKETPFDCRFFTFGIERYLSIPDLTKVYDCLNGVPFDQVCVLVNSSLYGGGGIYNFYNVFTADHPKAGFLFVHEFGHGFAGLADEYFSGEVAYENLVRTDIEPVEPNITTLVDFNRKWVDSINDTIPIPTPDSVAYHTAIGVFEGAAYKTKGVYRPAYDCAMRSSTYSKFCAICQKSIERMIRFYAD